MTPEMKSVAELLLQARLDGETLNMDMIHRCIQRYQPTSGFSYSEWGVLSTFIEELKPANVIPEAKKLAEKYSLNIRY